jgi:hypothetical protein
MRSRGRSADVFSGFFVRTHGLRFCERIALVLVSLFLCTLFAVINNV